jgi:hypothetical protein
MAGKYYAYGDCAELMHIVLNEVLGKIAAELMYMFFLP